MEEESGTGKWKRKEEGEEQKRRVKSRKGGRRVERRVKDSRER